MSEQVELLTLPRESPRRTIDAGHQRVEIRGEIRIGNAAIAPGLPAYVIAEIGVNHDGLIDQARRLVDVARDCGADAVKFQVFRAEELTTATAATADYQRRSGATSQRELLAKLELDDAEFATVRAHCKRQGIEFLATPFGIADVDRLMTLEVRAFKLASTDLNNLPLVRAVAATGLPMIVSTGASLADEIAEAVAELDRLGALERVILLHCVSAYPTPIEFANLRAIRKMHEQFGVPVGFSDHTTLTQTGAWAVAAGACVLEKHITLDQRAAGPDHALSLEPPMFREYVAGVRGLESALGTGDLGFSVIERDVRRAARKSIVAARELRAGDLLDSSQLTLKRPAGGLEPRDIDGLIGRRLKRDLAVDELLTWNDVE